MTSVDLSAAIIYRGRRTHSQGCVTGAAVTVTRQGVERPLDLQPSLKIWNHSPDGFEWGYGGSGPAQLALAILYDSSGDAWLCSHLHQEFKWQHVAKWGDSWEITASEICDWILANVPVENAGGAA